MISKKTVFVLGAGASFEADMPVGDALRKIIANMLRFSDSDPLKQTSSNALILKAIEEYCNADVNRMVAMTKEANRLSDALQVTRSIDDTLRTWQPFPQAVFCGKAAIFLSILKSESSSKLGSRSNNKIDLENLRETWYYLLFSALTANQNHHDDILDNIDFIDFNYDRCFELYLAVAIRRLYPDCKDVDDFLNANLRIVHPYGSLGKLTGGGSPSFGGNVSGALSPLIGKILTYHEQVSDPNLTKQMGMMLQEAERIVFLGFAFHKQNVDLLTHAATSELKNCNIAWATVHRMPGDEITYKQGLVQKSLGIRFNPVQNTAAGFLANHAYELWFN